uniref:Uncharacterized protein n=1 Tax=Anguilla anguilla TaxID=7936 RepID=A0A0E9XYV5_ANGAN
MLSVKSGTCPAVFFLAMESLHLP